MKTLRGFLSSALLMAALVLAVFGFFFFILPAIWLEPDEEQAKLMKKDIQDGRL